MQTLDDLMNSLDADYAEMPVRDIRKIASLYNPIQNLEYLALDFVKNNTKGLLKNAATGSYQIHFPKTTSSEKRSFWSVSVKNSASWYSFRLELENSVLKLSVNRVNINQDKASKYVQINIDKKTTWAEALEKISALWAKTLTPVNIWLNSDEHI